MSEEKVRNLDEFRARIARSEEQPDRPEKDPDVPPAEEKHPPPVKRKRGRPKGSGKKSVEEKDRRIASLKEALRVAEEKSVRMAGLVSGLKERVSATETERDKAVEALTEAAEIIKDIRSGTVDSPNGGQETEDESYEELLAAAKWSIGVLHRVVAPCCGSTIDSTICEKFSCRHLALLVRPIEDILVRDGHYPKRPIYRPKVDQSAPRRKLDPIFNLDETLPLNPDRGRGPLIDEGPRAATVQIPKRISGDQTIAAGAESR